jgi:hypothetical protein
MKIGIVCYVTEESAQSIIIFVTLIISIFIFIIIIVFIITSTIISTIQTSACCNWHSQRPSIHVTEQACWGKLPNLDILTDCREAMGDIVKLNKVQ